MKKVFCAATAAVGLLGFTGCEKPYVAEFEPNMVYSHRFVMELESEDVESMDEDERKEHEINRQNLKQAIAETQQAVSDMFGTPDDPKLPRFITEDEEFSSMLSMDHLMAASGSPTDEGRGLYRQYCSTCHGITGNGRGTTAALIDPYPRDYRMGKFKFKSTEPGAKPSREDLHYIIEHGVSGTPMKSLRELAGQDVSISKEDIEALVDYVIYLSMRGEIERMLLEEGSMLEFNNGESLYNKELIARYLDKYKEGVEAEAFPTEAEQEAYENFVDAWEYLKDDVVLAVADSWLSAEESAAEIPEPQDVVVPETIDEVVAAAESDEDSPVKQSIARGRELFVSEKAACSKCHGKEDTATDRTTTSMPGRPTGLPNGCKRRNSIRRKRKINPRWFR
ncbi:MAG: cytochrome c [Pirellulaceae bacterium]